MGSWEREHAGWRRELGENLGLEVWPRSSADRLTPAWQEGWRWRVLKIQGTTIYTQASGLAHDDDTAKAAADAAALEWGTRIAEATGVVDYVLGPEGVSAYLKARRLQAELDAATGALAQVRRERDAERAVGDLYKEEVAVQRNVRDSLIADRAADRAEVERLRAEVERLRTFRQYAFDALERAGHSGRSTSEMIDALATERDEACKLAATWKEQAERLVALMATMREDKATNT